MAGSFVLLGGRLEWQTILNEDSIEFSTKVVGWEIGLLLKGVNNAPNVGGSASRPIKLPYT